MRFEKGSNVVFSAHILPESTTDKTVEWSVDNPDVATIDNNGLLSAHAKGTVTITAKTNNNIQSSLEIEIYEESIIIDIIAGAFVIVVLGLTIGIPVFLLVFLTKKFKKGEQKKHL